MRLRLTSVLFGLSLLMAGCENTGESLVLAPQASVAGPASGLPIPSTLPKGWTFEGPPGMPEAFVETTNPVGEAASDPDFLDGTGSDIIDYRATLPAGIQGALTLDVELFYQAIPPDYLQDRFKTAKGPATRRLHYMASRIDVDQTTFKDWKLPITSATKTVTP